MKIFFRKIKHQNISDEFDESKCKALTKIFIEEKFQDAVDQVEKYFIKSYNGTYKQFIDEVKSTQKTNCCLFSWNTSTLGGVCLDCQNNSSCLCIPCFLAKHHEDHQSYIKYFDSGNCDCGDPSFLKPSGFCPHHPGPDENPDITQMTPETRKKFITVFRAAFTAVFLYSPYGRSKKEKSKSERFKKPQKLIEYIKGFIPYGDGLRRCAAYAIIPVAKEHFFKVVQGTDCGLTENILSLFGLMISDVYFRDRMSIISFREFNTLFGQMATCIFNKQMESGKYNSLHSFFSFTFHFITDHSVLYSLNKESFEWSDFLMGYLSNIYLPISMTNFEYDNNFDSGIFDHFNYVYKFLKIVVGLDDQHSNIQKFIDNYSYFLNKNERKIKFFVRTTPQDEFDDGYTVYYVTYYLSLINSVFSSNFKYSSPMNTEYSLSKIFENLVEYLDRANIKAESILNAQEKCSISTLVMLHSLFFVVLAGCKNPKEELKSLCEKRKWDFNFFCSIVVVCPLRAIAALFSYSKFSKLNKGHKLSLRYMIKDAEITFNQMFGLVQLILSICDNKSKVMNSILITFGVFDDISIYKDQLDENEYERQKSLFDYAYFDCAIFVLSLLTDNTVLSFDNINFKRLRVIELLKRSKATASEIEDYVDEKLSNPVFADVLLEYIERVNKKNGGSYFRLKSDGDFNPFFPPIMQMDRLSLLGKYNDQLLPLSDGFEDLKRNISLKECFKTPEFFCLCFHLLSSPNSNALMKKVGLAMSMCFINNTSKFPPQSYKDSSPVTIVAPSLKELIKNVSENDLMKKENWLTANLQIESNNKQEKFTLIKLILMQENLGKLVIEKTDLPEDLCRSKVDEKQQAEKDRIDQLIKEKKAKAALLKQRLMKDFQNKRKQFNNLSSSDIKIEQKEEKNTDSNNDSSNNNLKVQSEDDDEFNSSQQILTDGMNNVLCNVCLSQQDDIFGVPCLSVPSILPSLVSSQTHKKSKNIGEHQVTYMMNICSHFVHYKCYVKVLSEAVKANPDAKTYHCMMDRGLRNCFLPIFDQVRIDNNNEINYNNENAADDEEEQNLDLFLEKPPVMTKVAITDFIRRAFDEKAAADIILPLRSFAAAVLLLEVRHRNRPDVLDSSTVPLLLRNFLLTIYHGLHVRVVKGNIESEQYKDEPLLRLIIEIVKSDDPRSEFHDKVKEVLQSINKKSSSSRILEFLRRAAIIEDVAINSPKNHKSFIDWDEVLSEENLIARFEFKQTSFHKMKRFKMIKLPKKFIGLYLPPYKVDICDSSILKALDIITGEVVKLKQPKKYGRNEDDGVDFGYNESPYKPIEQYEKEVYKGGIAMYLVLTGEKASSVMFHSEAVGKTWMVDGFYVDQFGDTDHGFKRGLITKLSKDNQSNTLDKFMSGEVALY